MYTSKHILEEYHIPFPLRRFANLEHIIFLDIETTGLSPQNSSLYMIGLAYYENGQWCIEQWMAERAAEERELLIKLSEFLPRFTHIFHFNGNRFDIPYLTEKAKEFFVELSFDPYQGIDIYKRISPFKSFLFLPDCRQKTLEQYLGINRIDKYTGGELIQIYKTYLTNPSSELLSLLVQHNFDDMKGMLDIVPILSYCELCEADPTVIKAEMISSKNIDQQDVYELSMTVKLTAPLPKKIFAHYDQNFLTAEHDKATIRVPVYEKELKFFYSNYKDYYYVPSVDSAFHKSVVKELDSSLRKQATAATCYTRKEGIFLKQYHVVVEPFFKEEYKDRISFFEITDETKSNRSLFTTYCKHILQTIIQQNKFF